MGVTPIAYSVARYQFPTLFLGAADGQNLNLAVG